MYKCKNCGASSIKWVGRCPECRSFNTMEESAAEEESPKIVKFKKKSPDFPPVTALDAVHIDSPGRIRTGIKEFDVSVGSGLVAGQSILIGGDPGIGKSTLMLQVAEKPASCGLKILYISTEESLSQILLRAKRLKIESKNLFFPALNDVHEALYAVENGDYGFMVIDSIQRITAPHSETAYGSTNGLREIAHAITSACLR